MMDKDNDQESSRPIKYHAGRMKWNKSNFT